MSNTAYDADVYDYNHLNANDKAMIDMIDIVKDAVLNDEVINDFIESKNFTGGTLQSIYKELLADFANFLRERVEYSKVDLMIEKIDGYTDEEFAKNSGSANSKEDRTD